MDHNEIIASDELRKMFRNQLIKDGASRDLLKKVDTFSYQDILDIDKEMHKIVCKQLTKVITKWKVK